MKTSFLISVILIAVSPTLAYSQKGGTGDDGDYGMFQSQQEYFQFMGDVKRNPETRGMVDVINDIVLQRPIGSTSQKYGGSGSTLGLLSNSNVREELEMMDDQYEELQEMNKNIQRRVGEQLRALDFGDRDNLASQVRKIQEQADKDLNSVLLPHQMTRLKQIRAQSQLRNRSFVEILTSEPIKSQLEISDDQSEELRETEKEIQADLEEEIAALREKAREKLLSRLKNSQKEKAQEIFGDAFDFGKSSKSKTKPVEKNSGQGDRRK